MRKRNQAGMAVVAAMVMAMAMGTALADGGVEVQVNRNDRPTADGTGALMQYRAAASTDSADLDGRSGLDAGGSGDGSAIEVRPNDPTRAERGWLCAVLETAIGDFVSIGLVCN